MSTPWPYPFPAPAPRAVDFDFDAFFATVQTHIQDSRAILGQAPLVPRNEILVGQEQLSQAWDSPNIIVVPRGFRYVPARNFNPGLTPRLMWSWWLDLEVYCWGDPDPAGASELYSFSTATELARQFLTALANAAGGPAQVQPGGSEWGQKTDVNRKGRVLILRPSFESSVNLDPPIQIPVATASTPGAVVIVSSSMVSPDGTSTETAAIYQVP